MRPDERHTFPEHASSQGNSRSGGGSGNDSSRWSTGDLRGKAERGKGKEKEKAVGGGGASGSPVASAAAGVDHKDVSVLACAGVDAGAGAGAASCARGDDFDTNGLRRKKLTYTQEVYRLSINKPSGIFWGGWLLLCWIIFVTRRGCRKRSCG